MRQQKTWEEIIMASQNYRPSVLQHFQFLFRVSFTYSILCNQKINQQNIKIAVKASLFFVIQYILKSGFERSHSQIGFFQQVL